MPLSGSRTIADALAEAARALKHIGSSPGLDAGRLLSHVLARDPAWLIVHGDEPLADPDATVFSEMCAKRRTGMPVAYITGSAGFFGRIFLVNESVLIPRPETEHLVVDAIARLRGVLAAGGRPIALDVGFGCGAIACTLAAEIPEALVDGSDTSASALRVAQENALRLGVGARCRFFQADIVQLPVAIPYDVIVANLPYIPAGQIPRPPDGAGFEPRAALDGGPDGLREIRKLLARAPAMLAAGGLLLMEAAPPVMPALLAAAGEAFPEGRAGIRLDYAGLERYVYVENIAPGAANEGSGIDPAE